MRRRVLAPALSLTLVLAVGACGGEAPPEGAAGDGAAAAPSADETAGGDEPTRYDLARLGVDEGDPEAPIHVIEFSDFGCPHCRSFHEEVYPTVHEEYVETGKVVWKYVPYVLGSFPNSTEAARAGECAIEQDAFPRMRDRIFAEQDAWIESRFPTEDFVGYADELGLDLMRFRSCIEERRRDDRVQTSIDLGRRLGVRGTPTFFIEGQPLQGNRPPEFFREVFDRMLEEMESGEAAGAADTGA